MSGENMKPLTINFILAAATLLLSVSTGLAQTPVVLDAPYQVRYAANLQFGESYVDIINTGANGAPAMGPGFGAATGNICANVYVITSDEQLDSCCSCLITPNQTASLRVNADLLSNPQTGTVSFVKTAATLVVSCGVASNTASAGSPSSPIPTNIPNTAIFCPQFNIPGATLNDAQLQFDNNYSIGFPTTTNQWTYTWTNIPTPFVASGTH